MPSKQFLKGKHQLTLYPTTSQLEQLKIKMRENGYKTLTKYLIDMGLNATVKTTIEVDSTHKNNTEEAYRDRIHERAKQIIENNTESNQLICESIQKSINEDIHNGKYEGIKPYQPKSSMVNPLPKGGVKNDKL